MAMKKRGMKFLWWLMVQTMDTVMKLKVRKTEKLYIRIKLARCN